MIDLKALKAMSEGNPTSKVMVSRAWLREVHRMLEEGEAARVSVAADDAVFDRFVPRSPTR